MAENNEYKQHNVIFDECLHYVVPLNEMEDKKAELKEDFTFIEGFDDMDEAFDHADKLNEDV